MAEAIFEGFGEVSKTEFRDLTFAIAAFKGTASAAPEGIRRQLQSLTPLLYGVVLAAQARRVVGDESRLVVALDMASSWSLDEINDVIEFVDLMATGFENSMPIVSRFLKALQDGMDRARNEKATS